MNYTKKYDRKKKKKKKNNSQLKWNKGNYQEGRLEFTTPDPQYTHLHSRHTNTHTHTATQLLSVSDSHLQTLRDT